MNAAIKALVVAQKQMGAVIKNTTNPHLKSKYADLGAVLDACQSALHGNGFAIMQPCGKDEFGAYVDTVLAHESGEILSSRVYLVIGKQDMQGVGSAITYARRYGLLGMTGLAPEDDDGEATKAPKPAPRQEVVDAPSREEITAAKDAAAAQPDLPALVAWWKGLNANARHVAEHPEVIAAKDARKAELTPKEQAA